MSFIAPALRRQLASAAPRSSLRFASTQAVTHSSESSISKLVPVEVYPLVALVGCISIVGTGFILNAFGQEGLRLFPARFTAAPAAKEIWEQ